MTARRIHDPYWRSRHFYDLRRRACCLVAAVALLALYVYVLRALGVIG